MAEKELLYCKEEFPFESWGAKSSGNVGHPIVTILGGAVI